MADTQEQQPPESATPRSVIESMVRSMCGFEVETLLRLTSGGLNETYRAEIPNDWPIVVRIARRPVAWFTDEPHLMTLAREVGVPTPEVLGVAQVELDGELLSFSIQRLVRGRSLEALAAELPPAELERLIRDGGELLARLHSVVPDQDVRHELKSPDENLVARVIQVAEQEFGSAAAVVVERGAQFLRDEVMTRSTPTLSLGHGDWLPKHLLVDAAGAIVGVIDWEFAGTTSPAYDLAHWEVSAGGGLHDRSDLLCRGYARVADPDAADGGWVPAFAIHFALDVISWRNPASPERLRRCVDVISRYLDR